MTATAIGNSMPTPWVQLMFTIPLTYCQSEVGSASVRTSVVQYHCMKPSRMSAKPSEALAFTSGSRAASGGPNTIRTAG